MGEENLAAPEAGRPPFLAGIFANRNLLIIAGASLVVFFIVIFVVFGLGRSIFPGGGGSYTVILSHLTPKEAAEVAGELKSTLKIPYRLQDDGTAVAVPKNRADDARIGLASKGLPQGGVVGFEIFDKGGLGTTDFDRRIKFIRAISGELSRNISRMSGVEEARVQIVIPETQIFVPQRSPVTASVLLRLRQGINLNSEQVEGIIRLVCGSVEGLKTENVTVVDINGYILSKKKAVAKTVAEELAAEEQVKAEEEVAALEKQTEEATIIKAGKAVPTGEQAFAMLSYKEKLEENLGQKAQAVLDVYYLPNKARVWVNVDLKEALAEKEAAVPEAAQPQPAWEINKLSVVILVDDKEPLARQEMSFAQLKKVTFEAVAGAIGYEANRGDRIELKRVPFGEVGAISPPTKTGPAVKPSIKQPVALWWASLSSGFGAFPLWLKILLGVLILGLVVFFFLRRRKVPIEIDLRKKTGAAGAAAKPADWTGEPAVQKIRQSAQDNPEQFAEVIKDWLKGGPA